MANGRSDAAEPASVLPKAYPRGRLILVVGPSGAGKDTLLRMARSETNETPAIVYARRAITRPAGLDEDNIELSREEFDSADALGCFAMSWSAHGHSYAIPLEIEVDLASGKTVVANASRTVVETARSRYAHVGVAYIHASSAVRAGRLAGRGRESETAISERLAGDAVSVALSERDVLIDNNAGPAEAARRLLAFIGRPPSRW